MEKTVVEMRGITKIFPGIVANDKVDLSLREKEILAILGENGAGKSTLMSVLFGFYQAEEGEIYVRGEKVNITSPSVAFDLGIGMVHQHFQLIQNFTVTENIILGDEPHKNAVLDMKAAKDKVVELSEKYKLNVDPDAKIEDISVGMQQRVEILKVLYRNAEIIILDEPTAVLTPQEIDELMSIMHNLVDQGKSVILITHKLKEIMQVSDRVSVLRQGKMVGTVETSEVTTDILAEMMVGRKVNFAVDKEDQEPGAVLMEIRDLTVKDSRDIDAVKGLSLELRSGEILGIAGVDGNGQHELVEALTGLRKPVSGSINFFGKEYSEVDASKRNSMGVGHIPEDRQKRGLVLDFNLYENLILERYKEQPYNKSGFLNFPEIKKKARHLIDTFDVRSAEGEESLARTLSGGNQQKAIIAREVDMDLKVMIASQPTRGLDVGAIEYIHSRLVELRDAGAGVLLVSYELEEILNLSDRIAVIYEGRIVGITTPEETSERALGLMMSGSSEVAQ